MKNRDDPGRREEKSDKARKRAAKQEVQYTEDTKTQLADSSALHASILKAIPHAVFGVRERTIVFANDAVERVFGWKPEDLEGKSTRILFPSDAEYEEIGRRYRFLERNGTDTTEIMCRHKDGKDIFCRVNIALVDKSDGKKQAVAVYEDITEQKRMLKALRTSEEKYRDLYENAVEGSARSSKIELLEVNPALARMHGFDSSEEMVGTMRDVGKQLWVDPEERERYKRILEEKGFVKGFENQVYKKDGSTIWTSLSTRAVYDSQGRFLHYEGTVIDITARKEAEEALRESEEKFKLLFERSMDPILLVHDGVYIDCNEAAVKLMGGSSKDQLIGLNIVEASPERQPDDRLSSEKAHEITKATIREGASRFEWMRRDFYGKEFWVEVSQTLIPIHGKQVLYTVWRDIRERKRAEEELLTAQLQLSSAMDLAHIVYWETDPVTEDFIFNDPFYAFYGTTAEQEGGYLMKREEYSRRFIHPDDRDVLAKSRERRISTAEREFSYDIEHRIIRRDDEVRHIVARIRVSKDATGRMTKCFGANQDITERKKAEELLKESEEHYRVIFENSGTAMAILDEEGSVSMANSRCEGLFGCSKDEVQGRKEWLKFVADSRQRKMLEANYEDRRAGFHDVPACYEIPIVTKDGTTKHAVMNVATIPGTKKTVVSFVDITDQKKTHEELQEAYRRLQEIQTQLVRSARLAVVGQLASGVAHEIKNPLAIIVQGVEYLQSSITSGPEIDVMEMIRDASWRADKTVKDLLLFSRESVFMLKKSNIASIIEETLLLLKPELRHTKIRVVKRYDEDLPKVRVDRNQIKQAFINIIMNAVDAMTPPGKGMITITANRDGPEGAYVRVEIADTGVGIPDGYLDRIFDPFFSTKRKEKNVGLGLSTTQHIVERHNGRIQVERNKKKGVRVIVDLPAVWD